MIVRELIAILEKSNPNAYVCDREFHGITRVFIEETGDIAADERGSLPYVMLYAPYAVGINGT